MIPSKLLKMAANIVASSLTSIFSKSILTGIYPNDWKMTKVTPLFKKGIKSYPNNYRPISVIRNLEATNAWSVNIDNGLLNDVVFIDLNKAFDTIDHEIILRKMPYLGVDQAAIKWF